MLELRRALMVALAFAVRVASAEPAPKLVEDKAARHAAGADDEHVKRDSAANDPRKKRAAPPSKGGRKTRGDDHHCDVHIDNRTPWKIRFFVEGELAGMVPSYGDGLAPDVSTGVAHLYARAEFTDGSTLRFGPREFECAAYATYTWKLTE